MANPALIDTPADQWTKVADSVTSGIVWIKNTSVEYLQTYRVAADPVPTSRDEGVPLNDAAVISDLAAIDVYVYAIGGDGRVRVDI